MPYKSLAQERFFHSPGAAKAGITQKQVDEYDQASKGKDLPERKSSKNEAMKKVLSKYQNQRG
jgi:hypothetical protein